MNRGVRQAKYPDDGVEVFRDDADCVPGVLACQRRIVGNSYSLYPAFASLEVMDVDAAIEFIERPLLAAGLAREDLGKLIQICMYFGIIAVESERERVRRATVGP